MPEATPSDPTPPENIPPDAVPTGTPLPTRFGPRPRTTTENPQTQLDQQPDEPFSDTLLRYADRLDGVTLDPSNRAPPGTTGFHLDPDHLAEHGSGPAEAFLLDREFAHVHPGPDHSLHMILPEPLRSEAIEAGWAEPHPMAGQPTVSPLTVLVYAPRDEEERDVILSFLGRSWSHAAGHGTERKPQKDDPEWHVPG